MELKTEFDMRSIDIFSSAVTFKVVCIIPTYPRETNNAQICDLRKLKRFVLYSKTLISHFPSFLVVFSYKEIIHFYE